MTPFRDRRYAPAEGGASTPADETNAYDFERLARAVRALAEECRTQRASNEQLRRDLDSQRHRIRALEGQLLEANQTRQDVAKRVDELIAQLDHLDGELGAEL